MGWEQIYSRTMQRGSKVERRGRFELALKRTLAPRLEEVADLDSWITRKTETTS
jgi:hypothetical protein